MWRLTAEIRHAWKTEWRGVSKTVWFNPTVHELPVMTCNSLIPFGATELEMVTKLAGTGSCVHEPFHRIFRSFVGQRRKMGRCPPAIEIFCGSLFGTEFDTHTHTWQTQEVHTGRASLEAWPKWTHGGHKGRQAPGRGQSISRPANFLSKREPHSKVFGEKCSPVLFFSSSFIVEHSAMLDPMFLKAKSQRHFPMQSKFLQIFGPGSP